MKTNFALILLNRAMKKILIIEDEIVIAEDIQNILEKEGYEIAGIAECYDEAIKLFNKNKPDIIISDIYLKDSKTGIDIVKEFLKSRAVPVIFITAYSSNEIIEILANFNSITYITKPFTDGQLIAAVKLINTKLKKNRIKVKVTHREQEIVDFIINGFSSKEIADKLFISPETVRTHRKNIFSKFNVNSATQLINTVLNNSIH
jgi:DNA-binding NarL/FixJ family response regulator